MMKKSNSINRKRKQLRVTAPLAKRRSLRNDTLEDDGDVSDDQSDQENAEEQEEQVVAALLPNENVVVPPIVQNNILPQVQVQHNNAVAIDAQMQDAPIHHPDDANDGHEDGIAEPPVENIVDVVEDDPESKFSASFYLINHIIMLI
jgi:hypothetical protein